MKTLFQYVIAFNNLITYNIFHNVFCTYIKTHTQHTYTKQTSTRIDINLEELIWTERATFLPFIIHRILFVIVELSLISIWKNRTISVNLFFWYQLLCTNKTMKQRRLCAGMHTLKILFLKARLDRRNALRFVIDMVYFNKIKR